MPSCRKLRITLSLAFSPNWSMYGARSMRTTTTEYGADLYDLLEVVKTR
jgi:hypothetical protein